jgi:hypothetical protein
VRIRKVSRFVPDATIRMVPDGLRKAEAGARPKPKHIRRLERHAEQPFDGRPRLKK